MRDQIVFRGIHQVAPNDYTELLQATNRGLRVFKHLFQEYFDKNPLPSNAEKFEICCNGEVWTLHDLGDQWYIEDAQGIKKTCLQYYGDNILGYGYDPDNKKLVLQKLIEEFNIQPDMDSMCEANVRLEERCIDELVDHALRYAVEHESDKQVILHRPTFGSFSPYDCTNMPKLNIPLVKAVLPHFISASLDNYTNQHQKDCYFLSFLAHLSGCIPNLNVVHDKKVFSPNINLFISAPAASGKSAMDHAARLFMKIDEIHEEDYQDKMRKYKEEQNDAEGDDIKPIKKLLFIPGNTSSSAIIKAMHNNGGYGILSETEADTLANVLAKDWANFDDLLRKAFQNESVSQLRTNSDNTFVLRNPQLSVILTGTPEQICKLIPSTENGLFSRFLYYYFENPPAWRRVFNSEGWQDYVGNDERIEEFILALYRDSCSNDPIYFEWSWQQAYTLDNKFEGWLRKYHEMFGPGADSVVYRLGLICTRIAGVLAYLEAYYSNSWNNPSLTASKDVFELSQHIVDVLIDHSLFIFQRLPAKNNPKFNKKEIEGSKNRLWELLPDKFTRKEVIDTYAPQAQIKPRTADLYLSEFLKYELLEKGYAGEYKKLAS